MKRWLTAQDPQPATVDALQLLLDAFVAHYNDERPHRSLPDRQTPAVAYRARPKATPSDRSANTHDRVRHDVVDQKGRVTLRVSGRMHHIGIGMIHAGRGSWCSCTTSRCASSSRRPASSSAAS